MNSEIIGRPTDLPWAFIFTQVDDLPRHPSQLYESLCYFIIFLIAYSIYKIIKDICLKSEAISILV